MKLNWTQAVKPAPTPETESPRSEWVSRVSEFAARHPVLAIVVVSLLAVALNCHPVIFCGKSFVSPIRELPLVYDWWPPLPAMDSTLPGVDHGVDTAAGLLWGLPMGFVASRSLWEYGELPLWNRYGHAGDTLIGQAISMLGDPLQMIVVLGHGSAGAWDIKFLTAKFLFCVGFGLLVLRLLGSLPLSLISAMLAAYSGVFLFAGAHPVFFVLSYAPWILLSALKFLDVKAQRPVRWGVVWLLANVGCFNAGHAEVAVVLIAGLNLAGLATVLIRSRGGRAPAMILARIAAGTALFLGLTSPVWIPFFVALEGAYSVHTEVRVVQLPLVSLAGVLDDIFFRLPLKAGMESPAPGTSLLVGVGCVLSVLRWRHLKGEPFFWVNGAAILIWGGCVFGGVPASVIAAVPLLNRVGHIYTDFSQLLAIHLTIQCVHGFKALACEASFRRVFADLLGASLIIGAVVVMYCLGLTHRPVPWDYLTYAGVGAVGAPLLFTCLKYRRGWISPPGWAAILLLGFVPHVRFGLYSLGDPHLLVLPGPRVRLDAPSEAIARIKSDPSAPFRVAGVRRILFGDYAAVYGLEDVRSCAPLSNGEFVNLLRNFPGMKFDGGWLMRVANPLAAQPLLNLLNVKYVLTPPDLVLQEGLDFRVADRSDMGVLENLQVWPRAFFSDQLVSISSREDFVSHLMENRKRPFVALTPEVIGKQPALQALQRIGEASVIPAANYQLLPNSTSFDVHAPAAGIVCLAEGQGKDFTATANGEPKDVLTVNRVFKGVYLDKAGDYHIEFVYRPRHWRLACSLCWTALAAVIALTFSETIRNRKPKLTGLSA